MSIYLPIAQMSVSIVTLLAMGCAVGFLSGMFGVGGGFIMTPLLIFLGIPPAVAVGTGSAQIVASSLSAALVQYRRGTVDVRMGCVLLAGGLCGTVLGVEVVSILRRSGQLDLVVALAYVTFLSTIGTMMLLESTMAIRKVKPMRGQKTLTAGLVLLNKSVPGCRQGPTLRLAPPRKERP